LAAACAAATGLTPLTDAPSLSSTIADGGFLPFWAGAC
jgi:hypothetical protein